MSESTNISGQKSTDIGAKSATTMADRSTPLIRDHWYVAAWAEEITREPMRREILEQDIVFYRTEDGAPVALQNRCPHRSFPLCKGNIKGDRIQCGYHGIEFNPDGSCAHVPQLKSAPRAIRIESYPLVEQGPFIWIWMGGADRVDHAKLVSQPWFTEPSWTHVKGYFHMKANYLGLHENLLDLSHFPYVHGAILGRPEHAEAQPNVSVEGDVVHSSVLHKDVALPPKFRAAADLVEPVDRLSEQFVPSPAIHVGKAILEDSSTPKQQHIRYVIHCPTPETQSSTHYFWAVARDKIVDNKEVDEEAYAIANKAFNEDREALEDIEDLIARDKRRDFAEKIIATDKGAVHMLRAFSRMAAADK